MPAFFRNGPGLRTLAIAVSRKAYCFALLLRLLQWSCYYSLQSAFVWTHSHRARSLPMPCFWSVTRE